MYRGRFRVESKKMEKSRVDQDGFNKNGERKKNVCLAAFHGDDVLAFPFISVAAEIGVNFGDCVGWGESAV